MTSSSSSRTPCTSDGCKTVGILKCEGCSQIFCRKHVNEHRDLLSHQLDEIVFEHDTLQQMILEEKNKEKNYHPQLKQIDKWERDSIKKIQQTANEARQQIETLIGSQKEIVSKELYNLAEELKKARIDDDFVETDLRKWTSMLKKIQHDVADVCPSTTISEDPTKPLVAKIFVSSTRQLHLEQDERFGISFDNVCIAENGYLAYHDGSTRDCAFVCGMKEYSLGKYSIRFVMNKKDPEYVMSFNIISQTTGIATKKFSLDESSYGWYSDDGICCCNTKLSFSKGFHDMKDETTFEIELLIDCDNRKISYLNERTRNRREMNVDLIKCPFPWQLLFYLYDVEDSVRLLSSKKLL
ncbi:unnamed protein product [Rotaria sp. Silwood1]|nr:unnamed protein product [Rotaria sp. Silwood1]CAF3625640.1 unnamed protein product [Rotaria sp. Silwood1]CAF3669014.1 unnamed protein product [Rotaria sp. Silwood1]CAF4786656.1 unnamed protein product [Rotaria sp. Silwood1]CAF4921362.1 unnamed protein product [Rotaria sp. Silwood1]